MSLLAHYPEVEQQIIHDAHQRITLATQAAASGGAPPSDTGLDEHDCEEEELWQDALQQGLLQHEEKGVVATGWKTRW